MNRKILVGILIIEALACILFVSLQTSFAGAFSSVMAFPFEQIGLGLRTLSLSSETGNSIAIIIFTAFCLLPVAVIPVILRKRKFYAEDCLLVLLSAVLFAVMYVMINPGLAGALTFGILGHSFTNAIVGTIAYSVICGYLILRVLRLVSSSGTDKLVRYMSIMLGVLNMLFVYMIFGSGLKNMLDTFASLRANNIGNEHFLGVSYIFTVLLFFIDSLPYAFNIAITFASLHMLHHMKENRFSDEAVTAAKRISKLCTISLVTIILVNITFNLMPFIFAGSLLVISVSVQIPLISITFVMVALLLTRLIIENKQLKDDNDMFI